MVRVHYLSFFTIKTLRYFAALSPFCILMVKKPKNVLLTITWRAQCKRLYILLYSIALRTLSLSPINTYWLVITLVKVKMCTNPTWVVQESTVLQQYITITLIKAFVLLLPTCDFINFVPQILYEELQIR